MNKTTIEYSIVYKHKGDKYFSAFVHPDAHDYDSIVSRAYEWAEHEDIEYIGVDKTTIFNERCLVIKE